MNELTHIIDMLRTCGADYYINNKEQLDEIAWRIGFYKQGEENERR